MGCTQSKIENEEAVSRCKERRHLMGQAVSSRNAFAAAHSAYAVALKNTGAALSDYGQGEVQDPRSSFPPSSSVPASSSAASAAASQPPFDKLPPPPPPLPDFSPLQRSVSMPDLAISKPKKLPADPVIREEDDADILDDQPSPPRPQPQPQPQPQPSPSPPPPPPPPPMPDSRGMGGTWDYFFEMDPNMAGPSFSQADESLSETKHFNEEAFQKHPAAPSVSSSDDVPPSDEPPSAPEKVVAEPPPPPPPQPKQAKKQRPGGAVHQQHAASAGGGSKGKMVAITPASVSLLQILNELDDHFLKASQSAHDVSKMLEATRMHYHSNFADNRGHIDHSARVMRVITWNRSIKGLQNADDGKDDFDDDEWETHATVLDKMLAWEKKLYDEVKAGELMKIEYQKKVSLLNKQKKRGTNAEAVEKTKAAVSQLHTRYIVDMQSMDSTVSEINRLRDDRLYPKLVHLVDGMATMWETMFTHHDRQFKIVADLRSLDISNASRETSEQHYERTVQLWQVVQEWHSQFGKLVTHEKEYIRALNSWLKLNLIPIESSLKEKVSSPPRVREPPIQALLHAWHDQLEKLPDDLAKGAISNFSGVINAIKMHQQDELKLKQKCEETRKEYARKLRAFDDWHHKYTEKKAAEANDQEGNEVATQNDPVAERKFALDALKSKLEDEMEAHQKLCRQVREKSLQSLKTHLPELFRAMSDFSVECSEMYKKLRSITQPAESSG